MAYKNAPLVKVAFEARFAGDLSIETKRDEFQRVLKPEFPNLYVPNPVLGLANALQHYQFRKEDNSAIVSLAVNSFVYTALRYPGFDNFSKDLERAWKHFSDIFDIPEFTRLGLRYTNHLPIIRAENGTIPVTKYVTSDLNPITQVPTEKIYDVAVSVTCEMSDGQLRLAIQNEKGAGGLEILVLDLDFSRTGAIKREEPGEFMPFAHKQIEKVFSDLISQDYKEIMEAEQ